VGSRGSHRIGYAAWAQQVDFNGFVEGGVKGHGCRRVNDRVTTSHLGDAVIAKTKQVLSYVSRNGANATSHLFRESIAKFAAKPIEAVVTHNFFHGAIECRISSAWTDQEHNFRFWNASQNALNQGCAKKAGTARYEEASTTKACCDIHDGKV
jgi:hypothetical protein